LRRRRPERAQQAQSEQFDNEENEETATLVDAIPDQGDEPRRGAKPRRRYKSKQSAAVAASLSILIVLSGLTGWLGYRTYQARETRQLRALFLQVGRQGALNLTTISATEAEADMKRILDSSTGKFYEQVQKGSEQFVAMISQVQTKTEGTIADAGIESEQHDQAHVLVAVNVKSSNTAGSNQPSRTWRVRITVQQVDGAAKISDVEFVP
jgi:Mce-associated membrane protein